MYQNERRATNQSQQAKEKEMPTSIGDEMRKIEEENNVNHWQRDQAKSPMRADVSFPSI